jgi:hypothetical protein
MNDLDARPDTADRLKESVRRALALVGPGDSGDEWTAGDDLPPAA